MENTCEFKAKLDSGMELVENMMKLLRAFKSMLPNSKDVINTPDPKGRGVR